MNDSTLIVMPRVGEKDAIGETVSHIFMDYEHYVIYETAEGGVRWTTGEPEVAARLSPITDLLFEVQALKVTDFVRTASVNRQIALALHEAFQGNAAKAESMLAALRARLEKLRAISGRLHYVASAVILLIAAGLPALVFGFVGFPSPLAETICLVVLFGALGAFLSITIRISGLAVDPDAPALLNWSLGASRIVVGLVAAVFTYALVMSKVVLGFVSPDNVHALLAIAFVSGFSESFVPNLVGKVENSALSPAGSGKGARTAAPTSV